MDTRRRLGRDAIDQLIARVQRDKADGATGSELSELKVRSSSPSAEGDASFEAQLLDGLRMPVRVELGRRKLSLDEALQLREGEVVGLDEDSDQPVTLWVGEVAIARGEVFVVDQRFCIRVTEILSGSEPPAESPS